MLTAAFQNHLALQFLKKPCRDVECFQLSKRHLKWAEGREAGMFLIRSARRKPTKEQTGSSSSACETQCFIPQALHGETQYVLRIKMAQNPTLFGKKFIKKHRSKGHAPQRKRTSKPHGKASKTALCNGLTPEKGDDERSAMEHKYARRSIHLDALAGSL